MRSFALLAVNLLVGPAVAAWRTSSMEMVRRQLKDGQRNLITFFVPGMTSSDSFLPEWEKVAESVDSSVNAMAVDCRESADLCQALDVVSFPTVRLYGKDGAVSRYRGRRKANPLLKFVNRLGQPAVAQVDTNNITDFSISDDMVFVAYLHDDDETRLLMRFHDLAQKYAGQYSFGINKITQGDSKVECYNNVAGSSHSAANVYGAKSLDHLVAICSDSTLSALTEQNQPRIELLRKTMVYYVTEDDNDRAAYNKLIKPAVKQHTNIKFVTVDPQEYPALPPLVGIAPGRRGLSMWNSQSSKVYVYSGDLDAGKIDEFLSAANADNLTPWYGKFDEAGKSTRGSNPPADQGDGASADEEEREASGGHSHHDEL